MNQPLPEPWGTALIRAGLTDPRYSDPRPSMGRLAEKANLNTTTVSRMVHGRGVPKAHNVQAVADALGVDAGKVAKWVGVSWTDAPTQYKVPSEVNHLSRREQDAITELIKAMAAARKGVVGDASQRAAAPTNGAPTGQPGWGYNETTGEVVPPPPGTPAGPAGPWGTKPTDFALPLGELPKKGRKKKRSGTHAPRDTEGRTT